MLKKPEILAPCGSYSTAVAAINAGADALFLAGNSFGARAYAKNFSTEELISVIELAHRYGVKIYLTLNTLLKSNETSKVTSYVKPIYEAGLDAVLVQDLGVVKILQENFPQLDLHTSTQFNVTGVEGARLCKDLGFTRVVAARETTLAGMKEIKDQVDTELEVFVHGAMCFSYSGRCLMSSMAGDRSGNRGRCAQPCRQMYDDNYAMSMRDMCVATLVPELCEIGVDSLKIEGRMKNEFYVASAVEGYRTLVDDYVAGRYSEAKAEKVQESMADVFNRGMFSTGYLKVDEMPSREEHLIDKNVSSRRGVPAAKVLKVGKGTIEIEALRDLNHKDDLLIDASTPVMMTLGEAFAKGEKKTVSAPETRKIHVGDMIYRNRNAAITEHLQETYLDQDKKIPITAFFYMSAGNELMLTFSDEANPEITATVSGASADFAKSRSVSDEDVREKLMKMGDSEFIIKDLTISNDGKSFVRFSDVNQLRRDAVEALRKAYADYYGRPEAVANVTVSPLTLQESPIKSPIFVSDSKQLETVVDTVSDWTDRTLFLDTGLGKFTLADLKEAVTLLKEREIPYGLATEYIYDKKSILSQMADTTSDETLGLSSFDTFYIRAVDSLSSLVRRLKESGTFAKANLYLADSLYVYNSEAAMKFSQILSGANSLCFDMPLELSERELDEIVYPETTRVIYPHYKRIPLMVTAAYDASKKQKTMKDVKGHTFFSIGTEPMCYNVLLDTRPLDLRQVRDQGAIFFSVESGEEVREVLKAAEVGDKFPLPTSLGHFDRPIL